MSARLEFLRRIVDAIESLGDGDSVSTRSLALDGLSQRGPWFGLSDLLGELEGDGLIEIDVGMAAYVPAGQPAPLTEEFHVVATAEGRRIAGVWAEEDGCGMLEMLEAVRLQNDMGLLATEDYLVSAVAAPRDRVENLLAEARDAKCLVHAGAPIVAAGSPVETDGPGWMLLGRGFQSVGKPSPSPTTSLPRGTSQ